MPVNIQTEFIAEGILLRPFMAEDAPALLEAVATSYAELLRWIPWVVCDDVEKAERLCARYEHEFWDHHEFRFAVLVGETFVGTTCFLLRGSPIDAGIGEIGMWIRSDWAGKGMATAVLRTMVEWGFRDWGWDRLIWKCDTANAGSIRVAEKCHFTLEGTLREDMVAEDGMRSSTHFFALLRSEWIARSGGHSSPV